MVTGCGYCVFQGTIMLVDFNPFATVTDGLLFSWEELIMWRRREEEHRGEVVVV